ncbi:hypothetical protein ACP70R_007406 [Stipagrostis hirtigluma subsp. patula]
MPSPLLLRDASSLPPRSRTPRRRLPRLHPLPRAAAPSSTPASASAAAEHSVLAKSQPALQCCWSRPARVPTASSGRLYSAAQPSAVEVANAGGKRVGERRGGRGGLLERSGVGGREREEQRGEAEDRRGSAVEVGAADEEGVEGALVSDTLVQQAGGGARVGEGAERGEGGRVAEVDGRGGVGGGGIRGQDGVGAPRGAQGGQRGGDRHGRRGGGDRRDLGRSWRGIWKSGVADGVPPRVTVAGPRWTGGGGGNV